MSQHCLSGERNRVAVALRTAATTLLKSDSYLGARYRNLRRQLPSFAAAVKAMGRYLAVLIYRLLTQGEAWVDRGATRFERRRTEQELANLNLKARAKGFKLIPITEAKWPSAASLCRTSRCSRRWTASS
jgi:transposase